MRNLPQSLATHVGPFKTDGRASDESYDSAICPSRWSMSPDSARPRLAASVARPVPRPLKRSSLCEYLVQHRARLALTCVSLIFLSIFLLVIYRQFGLVVFASTLSLIMLPALAALVYARRLKAKEQEKARQRALNRSQSQRASQRQHKTVQIYSTDVEMAPAELSAPKLQRKATQQKITIHLPPTVSDQ